MIAIGQTRNLTAAFVRYRNEARRARGVLEPREDRHGNDDVATAKLLGAALGGGGGGGGGGMDDLEAGRSSSGSGSGSGGIAAGYAPRWVVASEAIRGEMAALRDRLAKLRDYHAKALLVTFDTGGGGSSGGGGASANNNNGGGGSSAAMARVEALTTEARAALRRIDASVRALGAPPSQKERTAGAGGADDDAPVRLAVQRQLASALLKLSVEFRREETRFLNKMEAQRGLEAGSSLAAALDEAAGGAAAHGGGGGTGDSAGGGAMTQAQLQRVDAAAELIEERDREIKAVVASIVELAQVMRDLSTLVVEQGTLLDRVDRNVTEAAVRIDAGTKELVKAEQTQKSGRALSCIVLLLVLVVVFLIGTIIRHS